MTAMMWDGPPSTDTAEGCAGTISQSSAQEISVPISEVEACRREGQDHRTPPRFPVLSAFPRTRHTSLP